MGYGNALAETINGLFKTEVILHRGSLRNINDVEFATLERDGKIGLTIADYWSRSEIFHQRNLKWHIIANQGSQPTRFDSRQIVSGKPGAIHNEH